MGRQQSNDSRYGLYSHWVGAVAPLSRLNVGELHGARMADDQALLKEVALELWNTTKKLRPGLPKAPRAQLVLKALMIIGDVSDQLEAAMVLGLIAEQEPDDASDQPEDGEDKTVDQQETDSSRTTPRVVRKRSGSS